MDTLLSVDLGTTACKGALFSTDGQLLGSHTFEYPLIHCGPGCVEQDPELWWQLSTDCLRAAIASSGVGGRGVRAIGVSTQGISFVAVDRSGASLRNAICWLDSRAQEEADLLEERFGESRLFSWTGKRPGAVYMLPKLVWLRNHEPHVFERTHTFLMAHDFLLRRMCGVAVTDYSMAGGTLLLDVQRLEWCSELLDAYQIDRHKLPELSWSGSVAGGLCRAAADQIGVAEDIPVVIGGQDQKCAAFGVGIRPGVATVSLGTASAISALTPRPIVDPHRRIPTFPFVRAGLWDLEGVVGTAGAAVKWLRDTLFPGATYAELDSAATASRPGAGGLFFHPYLEGAASPWWEMTRRGAFSGLTLSTGRAEVIRSVLEGVAFEIKANLDVVSTLTSVSELIVFGGGARSALWTSIIADVCRLPVRVAPLPDVANWGACALAGLGVGLLPGDAASGAIHGQFVVREPRADLVETYDDLYHEYVLSAKRLLGL